VSFTQIIELEGVSDERALEDHIAAWDREQASQAPGYLSARVFADEARSGRYFVEVDFSSRQEAERNSAREETATWAKALGDLASGEPSYLDLRQVFTTHR